jgi:ABC-type uncharacterized transport system substrate-binding protein
LAPAIGWSHPHGSIECSAEVRLQQGGLAQLRGTLWLDEAHSGEALAAMGGSADQGPDPALMSRFAFGLKRQFGRLNWLFAVQADGQDLPLHAGDADLAFEGGRLRITVAFAGEGAAAPARQWGVRCADPSYYWVTSFHPSLPRRASDGPVPGGVRVDGCVALPLAVPAHDARGGWARHDWRCE